MSNMSGVNIKYPNKREELIGVLAELSSKELQIKFWIEHQDYPNASGIDQVFHFLFDDSDLGCDAGSEIGQILANKLEADKIGDVCRAISEIHERLGDVESISFINDDKWDKVVELSAIAHTIMIAPDDGE